MFLNYIHNFRGIAIILIVAGHSLCVWSDCPQKVWKDLFTIIMKNGTVLFVFIAGYLFQHLSQRFEYKDYLKKKIKFVILPYLLFSIPALIVRYSIPHEMPEWFGAAFKDLPISADIAFYSIKIARDLIFGAHFMPYWFIPMIVLFYIAAPLFIYIDRKKNAYWVLPISIIISILIQRPASLTLLPQSCIHFFSVYLFGMFCSRYKDRVIEKLQKKWIWIFFVMISTIFLEFQYPGVRCGISPFNYLQKMVLCLLLILCLFKIDKTVPERLQRFIGLLANYSFGIFFLHYYFLTAFEKIDFLKPLYTIAPGMKKYFLTVIIITLLSVNTVRIVKGVAGDRSRVMIGC